MEASILRWTRVRRPARAECWSWAPGVLRTTPCSAFHAPAGVRQGGGGKERKTRKGAGHTRCCTAIISAACTCYMHLFSPQSQTNHHAGKGPDLTCNTSPSAAG
jgi:hypothetical protein